MSEHNTFVATYAQPHLAEIDLGKMQNAGFDFNRVRIVSSNPPSFSALKASPHVLNSFNELDVEFGGCIPEDRIVDYEAEVGAGRLFILARGTSEELEQAQCFANTTHPENWDGLADATVFYGCNA